jgi:hypothetical protein
VVVADADVWCTGVTEAVLEVRDGSVQWAIPHWHVYRLTERVTAGVLAGRPVVDDVEQDPYQGHAGGGITVLSWEAFRDTPMDPRFVGWGQEDDAWALALDTLQGPRWRGRAQLHHLWHPAQPRWDREWGSVAGRDLYRRYERAASNGQVAMRALLAEAREHFAAA